MSQSQNQSDLVVSFGPKLREISKLHTIYCRFDVYDERLMSPLKAPDDDDFVRYLVSVALEKLGLDVGKMAQELRKKGLGVDNLIALEDEIRGYLRPDVASEQAA